MVLDQSQRALRAIRSVCIVSIVMLTSAGLMGQEVSIKMGSELREKADDIRASADNLFKLRSIPWVTDPAEGFRLAREENRPVFFYLQAGDPLEDC